MEAGKTLVRMSRYKGSSVSKLGTFVNVPILHALSQLIYLFLYEHQHLKNWYHNYHRLLNFKGTELYFI